MLAVLASAALAAPVAAEPLPPVLTVAPEQCPEWTAPDRPRLDVLRRSWGLRALAGTVGREGPHRLADEALLHVGSESYRVPVGYVRGFAIEDRAYDAAMSPEGAERPKLAAFTFWWPSGRWVERTALPGLAALCEAGRAPDPDARVVQASAHLYADPAVQAELAGEAEEHRRRPLEVLEETVGAPLEAILAGRVPEQAAFLHPAVPGAFYGTGLEADRPTRDPLRIGRFHVLHEGVHGYVRCTEPTNLSWDGRPDEARLSFCDVRLGPAAFDGSTPEVELSISRDRIGEWPAIHRAVLGMVKGWRLR